MNHTMQCLCMCHSLTGFKYINTSYPGIPYCACHQQPIYEERLNADKERNQLERVEIGMGLAELREDIKHLSDRINELDLVKTSERKPHLCPKCHGVGGKIGLMPNICIPCSGQGIVWG